jgi:hypothetical protein
VHSRPVFDSSGRRRGHVNFIRALAPAEFDARAADRPDRVRGLARAVGDARTGRQLLEQHAEDQHWTMERLAASQAGRRALSRLADAVRARLRPAEEAARAMAAAAAAAAAAPVYCAGLAASRQPGGPALEAATAANGGALSCASGSGRLDSYDGGGGGDGIHSGGGGGGGGCCCFDGDGCGGRLEDAGAPAAWGGADYPCDPDLLLPGLGLDDPAAAADLSGRFSPWPGPEVADVAPGSWEWTRAPLAAWDAGGAGRDVGLRWAQPCP